MNLVRLGHYFVSNNPADLPVAGSCRTALVIHVIEDGEGEGSQVNLAVWNQNGGMEHRSSVAVAAPERGESFHLSGECPWGR